MADVNFASPVMKKYPPTTSDLTLVDVSSTHKRLIRASRGSSAAAKLGVSFGASRSAGALICGSRPTEWLILGTAQDCASILGSLDMSDHVSVVDFTHGRALFRLTGASSAEVLSKVSSLDLSDAMTPDGAVASAAVATVTCDIVRKDRDGVRSYLVACDRSVGQYLFDVLIDSGHEFDIGVGDATS